MSKRKHLTQSEVERLLQQARYSYFAERNYCMIYMGFIHGLRVSELLSLRLSDIDLDDQSIYIHRLKNGLSTNHPLLPEEVEVIRVWLQARRKIRYAADSEWLFLSRLGTRLTRQQFYKIITDYGKKAEISICSHPHMLRHACGYALADRGIDTRLIQDYLGHRNIRHTVRYTASNAARFQGVWQCKKRLVTGQLGPKCQVPRLVRLSSI
ncbi:tyrosine-type DNA invertase [Edwardsiella tarda]|uniref:tyrosine-type DNA invertase n=1 Tax=Edwardsiella tarda TaxID=636 RepID=UPI000BE345F1|nr:tyrosine-type DNA invertase [Edwardsiella tarda]ATI64593.1 DNA recombinase [Edwardsiella tarda]